MPLPAAPRPPLAAPPPAVPSLSQRLDRHLLDPLLLPVHRGRELGRFWEEDDSPKRMLSADLAPVDTTLRVERDLATGKILGFVERRLKEAGSTAKNSTSLSRAPGPKDEATRGSTANYPFWPGGFDEDEEEEEEGPDGGVNAVSDQAGAELLRALEDESRYLTVPPGFDKGADFGAGSSPTKNVVLDLASVLGAEEDSLGIWAPSESASATESEKATNSSSPLKDGGDEEDALEFEDTGVPVLKTGSVGGVGASSGQTSTEWAEVVDVSRPIADFHERVPRMAFTWDFELDNFQKEAVLRLEQNESVFVAAHTSAGKTVVAEYAIALSQKHMTRTVYTSPIKALSNQKFRDFKDTFKDVGLVTGDIQINATATCLIMTTEILRSMLYNGSDIVRDMEYVIFDEVHYINDAERGVVWEEVLILLPDHVNIIMLSATVPNTLDFADWVGRTKKKKIYVISTLKRPVPLEHFLYTGSNAKSRDDRFLLQDASGKFLQDGYKKAVAAKKEKESKSKQQYGAKGVQNRVGPQQEKNIWLTLVDHLSRKDKLPVVAFTLSRNRCDQNAELLTSLDLTTAMEKSDIHHFVQRCVQRLKGSDRRLPQVLKLVELLKRGIGIHHSGILPILKEVVEMLFQRGWVKLLFATETFAMGVNMPARTVVFDHIKKHDGKSFRTLLPAEYIQMAGRAGRRGLDTTGTVIILCKNEVYEMSELHGMMQGRPTPLESKFRVTYSMILNLLRVEQLRVEDMMKRSFSEISSQKKKSQNREIVKKLKAELRGLAGEGAQASKDFKRLEELYKLSSTYFDVRKRHWELLLTNPIAVKALTPGRIVLVCHGRRCRYRLGMLLEANLRAKAKSFEVVVLKDEEEPFGVTGLERAAEENFFRYLRLCSVPDAPSAFEGLNPELLALKSGDIVGISGKVIKVVDCAKVLADMRQRRIPRFRDAPVGQSTGVALQELIAWTNKKRKDLDFMVASKDFKIQDIDMLSELRSMETARKNIEGMEPHLIPDFRDLYCQTFQRMSLKEQINDMEFLLSEASLQHHEDYQQKIEVLKMLGYIDDNCTVKLKGRVACEMGSQELIITELVLNNILTDRPPSEIAALLSCMVFQQKNCSAPELTAALTEGTEKIKQCALVIGEAQRDCGMKQAVLEYAEQFNFGLAEVVYEWARGMPFDKITQLTDVQEGVIVRTIQRLDETLRDVKDAARVIGDSVLYQKMDEASTVIKRDIVFAASLYTQ